MTSKQELKETIKNWVKEIEADNEKDFYKQEIDDQNPLVIYDIGQYEALTSILEML